MARDGNENIRIARSPKDESPKEEDPRCSLLPLDKTLLPWGSILPY
jgi:hypothetical protein